jgi:hypothetical protein
MATFNNKSEEIIAFLYELNNDQRRTLFGDITRFKNWLVSKKIIDDVSINLIIIQ